MDFAARDRRIHGPPTSKILLANLLAGRDLPHNSVALKFTLMYALVFVSGAIGSLFTMPLETLLPFALVAPFAVYQVRSDALGMGRRLIPELTGSLAISSSAAVIALNAGWTLPAAVALWGILAARSITSVFYVRNRLRLEKGKEYSLFPPIAVHFAAIVLIGCLAYYELASSLTVAVFVLLFIRACFGLSRFRTPTKAVKIGIMEVIYGLLTVTSIIAGHYIGV